MEHIKMLSTAIIWASLMSVSKAILYAPKCYTGKTDISPIAVNSGEMLNVDFFTLFY